MRESYEDPIETIETNTNGTLHILEALRHVKHSCAVVLITSDKVYENVEWVWGYRENDSLGGSDPYSASKAAAEILIRSYVRSYFNHKDSPIRIAAARAGNVIGGGDWAKERLIPDIVRSWSCRNKLEIRNPKSTRPWQHVLEPLSGYLQLAVALSQDSQLNGQAFNFGPAAGENYSVAQVIEQAKQYWDEPRWLFSSINDEKHEASLLQLNCDKAQHFLNWSCTFSFQEAIEYTMLWYQNYYRDKQDIWDFTISQISQYEELARSRGVSWAKEN